MIEEAIFLLLLMLLSKNLNDVLTKWMYLFEKAILFLLLVVISLFYVFANLLPNWS